MESRGDHSYGISDGIEIIKDTGAISANLSLDMFKGKPNLIGHTRFSTVGARTKANSHPWQFGEGENKIIGAHNGVLSNHWELNRKYERGFEVDSMHIFQSLLDEKPLTEIYGYGAVAYFQYGKIYLGRFNNGSLAIARTSVGTIFASTQEAVSKACKLAGIKIETFYQVDDEQLYVTENGQLYTTKIPFKFGGRYTSYSGSAGSSAGYRTAWDRHNAGSYSEDWKEHKYEYGRWNKKTAKWEPGKWEGEVFVHGEWSHYGGDKKFTPDLLKNGTKQLTEGKRHKKDKVVVITDALKDDEIISELQDEAENCELCQQKFDVAEESWESPLGELCDGCYDMFWNMDQKDKEDLKEYIKGNSNKLQDAVGNGTSSEVKEPEDPFIVTTVRQFLNSLRPGDVDERSNKELVMTVCDECSTSLTGDDTIFTDQNENKVKWILCKTCHIELVTPFHSNTSFNFPSA